MSDKDYGDCTNRNVVKNPLLSTAVTGLSVEDLTHNAVLLPAVPRQELISIQDQQNESQKITLRHSDQDITDIPSGDAAHVSTQYNLLQNFDTKTVDKQKQTQNVKAKDNLTGTKSAASNKSDDDFDVNEYFARLQSTRYVSAPLNSHLKEDQNANLPAEENLEEINLNEPEKIQPDDYQHSLTADIAQNFSQLPTVLPQVASAVFSSFSNMLSLKNRDHTPDDARGHAQMPEISHTVQTVPLGVPEPAAAVPPPLKEPPVSGNTSNYRITTKKKVYAQIPGLSSGENHIHTYSTPPIVQAPYFFTPGASVPGTKQENLTLGFDQAMCQDGKQVDSMQRTEEAKAYDMCSKIAIHLDPNKVISGQVQEEMKPISVFNQKTLIPTHDREDTTVQGNEFISPTSVSQGEENNIQSNLFTSMNNVMQQSKTPNTLNYSSNQFVPISQETTAIIPPPPMFSSLPRGDSQSSGKSILPPSVARRVSANQPVIKNETTSKFILPQNIFIPSNTPDTGTQFARGESHTNLPQYMHQGPEHSVPAAAIVSKYNTGLGPKEYYGVSISTASGYNPYIQTSATETQDVLNTSLFKQSTEITSMTCPQKDLSKSDLGLENRGPVSNVFHPYSENNKPPSNILDNSAIHPAVPQETKLAPPMIFGSMNATQTNITTSSQADQSRFSGQSKIPQFYSHDNAPEQTKSISQPPKVSGNLSYRMAKKRPQYYSGPIEGFGSISNNIKPTIHPVETNAYQGPLFNPQQTQSAHNLPVDYCASTIPSFDISSPSNLIGQSTIDPYITPGQGPMQPDFNTAFDLSRPTTESYAPHQPHPQPPEPKGFGIIGSLKSKLSSIDINKIQNTVTTFFDPGYNESKMEPKGSESSFQTASGNYQNFPRRESATLEVFVPNLDNQYHQANPHDYQMQTHQVYQNQQYYPTQEYFNQSQNYSNDYYSGNRDNSCQPKPDLYIPATHVMPESQVENSESIALAHIQPVTDVPGVSHPKEIKPLLNPLLEEKQHSIDNISQTTGTTKSVFDDLGVTVAPKQDMTSYLNPLALTENPEVIEETEITDSLLKNYYGYDKTDLQPPVTLFKEVKAPGVNKNECCTPTNDIITQLQSVADSTLKNVFDCQTPIIMESALEKEDKETFSIIPKTGIDPLKSFFDYQQPIPPIGAKIDNVKPMLSDPITNVDSSLSFFDYQAPARNPVPKIEDEYVVLKNTQSVISTGHALEMLTESTEFKGLGPVIKTRSEDLQPYVAAVSLLPNTFNEAPLFTLFDQPSLLPPIPSFDLSKISSSSLPASINESTDIKHLENKMDNISLFDNVENVAKFERKSSFFDKTLPVENDQKLADNQLSELNICETCREVNKPEEKEPDLTTQLIENIIGPIQLANPVDYPAASASVPDISTFSNQFAEITHIPEDIIETMKQPPSVEPIEDNINFGWSISEPRAPKPLTGHDYNFPLDPNIIGHFGDNSLFFENVPTNASDEIKAEYKISQEDTVVLPRQLSIPTAPPEEDNNSDESGLDVHSIEQDATKDFPIYEEFVIEPSETDDDKIEYKEREKCSEDTTQDVDTFTNRVERFKQMEISTEVVDDAEVQKAVNPITLATTTSPALTIASYFDTGNYAVENHYKNSLTSPTTTTINASIPPGFEDEFSRKLSGISSKDLPAGNVVQIPDTTTQTSVSVTLSVSQPSNTAPTIVSTEIQALCKTFTQEVVTAKSERLPAFSSIIEPSSETVEIKPSVVENKATESKPATDALPDAINFFSSTEDSATTSDAYSNFSRLSSYFTTPPQPDHSKSFFELSQSQNHYRHKPDQFETIQSNVKDFFEINSKKIKPDIPHERLTNMNLIHDLASHKNVTPKGDTVETVNYFTVEYDIDTNKIGEPKSSLELKENKINKNYDQPNELGDDEVESNLGDVVRQCKYCYDKLKVDLRDKDYKFKSCMDGSDAKNGDANMDAKRDNVKRSATVNFCDTPYSDETDEKVAVTSENRSASDYAPVKHHWFYRVDCEGKSIWRGFSVADSRALENACNSPDLNENTVVATDGGRFDVNVVGRLRIPVYWTDKPTNVMRCSWFYKGNIDARYVPYAESVAEKLEVEYRHGITTGEWHRRLMLPNNEMVVMHGPAVMVHFLQTSPTDAFGSTPLFAFGKRVYRNPPKIKVAGDQPNKIDHLVFLVHGAGEYRSQKEKIQSTMRPRVVRRGYVESEIEDTEPSSIDHLLLLCHGVGSACDMRFRSVEEVVDDFRTTSLQLIQSHYKNSYESGIIGRVEVLPISWHSSLHSGETGVDRRLAAVTLDSIPRLRNFTNDTILDVLFYTSPVYCQTIVDTVCSELNRIYKLFKARNPDFKGGVSLGGHSLGSVILYDLLCHQTEEDISSSSAGKLYVPGCAGTGQPTVRYPRLAFRPSALYALGSPIAIFECIRGVETLGQDFCLPTCKNFFNIFHPYDPIAYRLEPMINPSLRNVKPCLIPHHKGRKRMHLELKDTMARVAADIKQKLVESVRSTWSSMWRTAPPEHQQLEKVVEEEMEKEELTTDTKENNVQYEASAESLGRLNCGRRVDHVLQEAPFEVFIDYLFAMTSHVCYWESEDTMLVMLREIYSGMGVAPDCSLPQHTMTLERSRVLDDPDDPQLISADLPSTSRGMS